MDKIKVPKVERVQCIRPQSQVYGTIHLTTHHLIFNFEEGENAQTDEEMWVPYPLISSVVRLPQTLQGHARLAFRTRTFETFTLVFGKDSEATDVFESVRELTVVTSVQQLYAFDYAPNPPFDASGGWNIYNPREEFARMGIGSRTKAWRFTDLNKDYTFCPTYPARLVVPSRISDTTLTYAAKYRSKARIPALVYLHWANYGSITRSSQPMVGLTNNRSIQDEKLIEAIFQSHLSPESAFSEPRARQPVFGATATNLIIDSRPTANAMVMSVKGGGSENMENYKDGKKAYLGVDNIHVMRESLAKVAEALRDADALAALYAQDAKSGEGSQLEGTSFLDRQALRRSGWLRHISAILDGTLIIVKNIHVNSSHVLIHCSDGWDRTAQLSSLSQLCLDPFYRTTKGFQILIEKDWLAFGHKFTDRCGHLSSDKFFQVSSNEVVGAGGGTEAAQAFLASVQNKFTPQAHLKETSPVFHQFLECVRQIQRQYPTRFQFNGKFLEQLHYHLYACRFGTFLFNNERERRAPEFGGVPPIERTQSIWDFLNSSYESPKYINPDYDPSLDDRSGRAGYSDMGVLLPNPKDVRFWHELYGRTDEEMNGKVVIGQAAGVEVVGPVENREDDPAQLSVATPTPPSPARTPVPPEPTYKVAYQPRVSTPRSYSQYSVSQQDEGLSTNVESQGSVSKRHPNPRNDSFRALDSTSSAFSLRTSPSASSDSVATSTPASSTPQKRSAAEGGGFKSMWASFSSNANAAFSAVQGAVDGVTKDLRAAPFANISSSSNSRERELSETSVASISTLNQWDLTEDHEPSPWAVQDAKSSTIQTVPLSNPWSIPDTTYTSKEVEKPSRRSSTPTATELSSSVTLPLDPFSQRTARSGSPIPSPSETTNRLACLTLSASAPTNSLSRSASPKPGTTAVSTTFDQSNQPKPSSASADPLGVGFL
ncbi:hypothetical protein FRC02_009668 [Tulasnella sp. 418]|nr:hypothetical protein FRC02_009668 [Tulasnella sp. 418]